jgi:hypothetical protein
MMVQQQQLLQVMLLVQVPSLSLQVMLLVQV